MGARHWRTSTQLLVVGQVPACAAQRAASATCCNKLLHTSCLPTAIAVVATLLSARTASTQGAASTQGGNGEDATQVCHPSGPDVLESSTVAGVTHSDLKVAGASHTAGSEPSRPTPLKSLHSSSGNRYTTCQPYCRINSPIWTDCSEQAAERDCQHC